MAKKPAKPKKVVEPEPEEQFEEDANMDAEDSDTDEQEEEEQELPEEEAAPGHDPNEKLDPEKHVAIHLEGDAHKIMLLSEFPGTRPYSRTLKYQGKTVEHTHDHRGVWAYRHLG